MSARIYTYSIVNHDADDATVAAVTIDLDRIVAVKHPQGGSQQFLVQTDGAKGLYLPYDAAACEGLINAWKAYRTSVSTRRRVAPVAPDPEQV